MQRRALAPEADARVGAFSVARTLAACASPFPSEVACEADTASTAALPLLCGRQWVVRATRPPGCRPFDTTTRETPQLFRMQRSSLAAGSATATAWCLALGGACCLQAL